MITIREAAKIAKEIDEDIYWQGETKDAYVFFPKLPSIDDVPHGVAVYKNGETAEDMSLYAESHGLWFDVRRRGKIDGTDSEEENR